ncbi:MAG: biotin/lipoyl-containing protein, partial [Cyclonatronaceae bacterium]
MATVIEMPKLSDTMEEGTIANWNIKEGDTVESGDIVAEVETDKATMDLEAFDSGTVLKILVEEGDTAPIGDKLVILGEEGEDISDLLGEDSSGKDKESKDPGKEAGEDEDTGEEENSADKKDAAEKQELDTPSQKGKEKGKDKEKEKEKEKEKKKDKGKEFDPLFGDLKEDKKGGNGKQDDADGRVKASP